MDTTQTMPQTMPQTMAQTMPQTMAQTKMAQIMAQMAQITMALHWHHGDGMNTVIILFYVQ
jgi:hypothetical protein